MTTEEQYALLRGLEKKAQDAHDAEHVLEIAIAHAHAFHGIPLREIARATDMSLETVVRITNNFP